MSAVKLLNCPFCGSKAKLAFPEDLDGRRKYLFPEISCSKNDCGVTIRSSTRVYSDLGDSNTNTAELTKAGQVLAKKWNKRA